jgi:hypothetical protein
MITEEKKIRQKKISTIVNFSNSWLGSSTENIIHEKSWSLIPRKWNIEGWNKKKLHKKSKKQINQNNEG